MILRYAVHLEQQPYRCRSNSILLSIARCPWYFAAAAAVVAVIIVVFFIHTCSHLRIVLRDGGVKLAIAIHCSATSLKPPFYQVWEETHGNAKQRRKIMLL